ncbi:TIGR02444 family protein [Flocculibacter collagenilyticus]|uniref:TIGR02444 family protein n=1 Tax=Flocculibacter collagenilyticus TaxID=2744479 RepID=UPI0018F3198A|nr:TIGR02444 family protein [Flocculibacter collagenilyticus]
MSLPHRDLATEELWVFSLLIYSKANVKEICLYWQDKFGANVNIMLLLLWCDAQQVTLTEQHIKRLQKVIAHWNENYTTRLRALRISAAAEKLPKAAADKIKKSLLSAELELERVEQAMLTATLYQLDSLTEANSTKTAAAQKGNLYTYIALLTPTPYAAHLKQIHDLNQIVEQLG